MSLPAMHGWTHRPKELGGTDPIPATTAAGPKWVKVLASAQSITPSSGDFFFGFTNLYTNDTDAYEFADVTAGRAFYLQLNTPGYYTAKFTSGGSSVWDNTFYTKVTPMFELSGSPADMVPNLGDADFSLNQFNSDSEMFAGETAHKILWEEVSFHWNPDDPVSDMDFQNPLNITFRVETVGATSAVLLQAEMLVMRHTGVGYTAVTA